MWYDAFYGPVLSILQLSADEVFQWATGEVMDIHLQAKTTTAATTTTTTSTTTISTTTITTATKQKQNT